MDSQATPVLTSTPPQRSPRKKLVGSVVAVAVMVALGGLAWHLTHRPDDSAGGAGPGGKRGAAGRPGGDVPSTVGVATAEKADVPVVLDALGTVTAAATTTVRAQVSGILQKVLFTEGQMVKAGQVLAQIDPRQFEMALLQATGQRQRDEAQLDIAKLTLTRYQTLLKQDSIALQDVDTQAALVKQLDGTVKTDVAAEGAARLNLGYTKVVAPISGRVGLRAVDIGNLVSSGDANGLATITELSPIDVEFSIPQDNVPEVQQRSIAGNVLPAVALLHFRHIVLRDGEFDVDRRQLGDGGQAVGVTGADQVTDIDGAQADAAADRRDDFGVAEVQARGAFGRDVGLDGAVQLLDQRGLRVDVLQRDRVLLEQGLIARQRQLGDVELRLVALALAGGLQQRHLELAWIDLHQHLAGLDHLALGEQDFLQYARYLRAHRRGGRRRDRV